MRGTLDIESLSSQGGSVTLFLPMQTDTSEDLSQKEQDSSLKGLNVLIVDDNATLRSVIEKQLKRSGSELRQHLQRQRSPGHAEDRTPQTEHLTISLSLITICR